MTVEMPERGVLTVYDAAGKVVQKLRFDPGIHSLDVSQWAGGVYLLETRSGWVKVTVIH